MIEHDVADNENVEAYICYSRPAVDDVAGRDYDGQGQIDIDLLKRLLPGTDIDIYFCGPTPFMKSLFTGLLAWGVAEDRIHYEFFGPASALIDGDGHKMAAGGNVDGAADIDVTFARSGVTANWNPSFGNILKMAEGLGLKPDFSCRSGICNTCLSGLFAGEVEYVEEPLELPDPGNVLICCSQP